MVNENKIEIVNGSISITSYYPFWVEDVRAEAFVNGLKSGRCDHLVNIIPGSGQDKTLVRAIHYVCTLDDLTSFIPGDCVTLSLHYNENFLDLDSATRVQLDSEMTKWRNERSLGPLMEHFRKSGGDGWPVDLNACCLAKGFLITTELDNDNKSVIATVLISTAEGPCIHPFMIKNVRDEFIMSTELRISRDKKS